MPGQSDTGDLGMSSVGHVRVSLSTGVVRLTGSVFRAQSGKYFAISQILTTIRIKCTKYAESIIASN